MQFRLNMSHTQRGEAMKKKLNSRGGFSLLEVVICIAAVGILTVGTSAAFGSAGRMSRMADNRLREQLAVRNAAETVMAKGYNGTDAICGLTPTATDHGAYYELTFTSGNAAVTTSARKIP